MALLTEVETINPFAFKNQKQAWDEIAKNLQNSDLKMAVTERSCRDRMNMLLKDFKKDENLSQRRCVIEKQLNVESSYFKYFSFKC